MTFKVIPEYLQDGMRQRSYVVDWFNITTPSWRGNSSLLTPYAVAHQKTALTTSILTA